MKPLLFLLALLAAASPVPAAAPRYVLTDLGLTFNFSPSPEYDPHINAAGQVVLTRPSNGIGTAGIYTNGGWQSLGTLGGDRSSAFAVNDYGMVVGTSLTANNAQRAYVHTGGTMLDLGFQNSGQNPKAVDVNNAGWVAGEALVSVGNDVVARALRRKGSTTTNLGVLPAGFFGPYQTSRAVAINSAGDVLGYCEGSTMVTGFIAPANDSALQAVGGPEPLFFAVYPTAMNDAGQITGYQKSFAAATPRYAFVRLANGSFVNLGGLGGVRTIPAAINAAGQIVGTSDTIPVSSESENGSAEAFLFHEGKIYRLNDLVADRRGLKLNSASGINDAGQIVGKALDGLFNRHAYLLTPLPPILAAPTVRVSGKRTRHIRAARLVLRGTAADPDADLARVEVKVGRAKWKKARGLAKWTFVARRVKPGRTKIQIRAADATHRRSLPAKLLVIRSK